MTAERVKHIEPSKTVELTARIAELKRQGEKVIGLNVGEPDFVTPPHICAAANQALKEGFTKYTPVMGILPLREAICRKLERENHVCYTPDQITIGAGAKQCIYAALMAVCNPGEEIIIPYPCWVSYTEMVKMAGGTPVLVPCREDFSLDAEAIRNAVTDKTRGILINTPNNPTGAVYSGEALKELGQLAVQKDFYILADEVYEAMVYDGAEHVSIASLSESEEWKDHIILINSFSKTYAMTGWRLGYLAASLEVIGAVNKLQSQMVSSIHSLSQKAGIAALNGSQDSVADMVAEYEKRRRYVYSRLESMEGVNCRLGEGAFYLLPDIRAYYGASYGELEIKDDIVMAEYLLQEAHIAVVPGSAFYAPGHLRITYAASQAELKQAMDQMEEALEKLHRKS